MTTFQIKVVAIVCMVVDHIGLFFFPQYIAFRIVGRIAFPLFAWLIANGAHYTHNIHAYLIRLFAFALISQLPFTLANQQVGNPLWYLNVFFTLSLGLLAISVMRRTSNKGLWILTIIGCALIADVLNSDYGAEGVLSIVSFYLFFDNVLLTAAAQFVVLYLMPHLVWSLENTLSKDLSFWYGTSFLEAYGLFALIFIALYNKKEGRKAKYLFYAFYPVQYVVIFLLKLIA